MLLAFTNQSLLNQLPEFFNSLQSAVLELGALIWISLWVAMIVWEKIREFRRKIQEDKGS